jgi:murein DD-endopeptidase MepM/ murein hydrolase activator NlpD
VADLVYPLQINNIRGASRHNGFGKVRNGGTRPHQGWDLIATPLTPCFAIADGVIADFGVQHDYGQFVLLRFEHRSRTYYAAYCHLSVALARRPGQSVAKSELIAYTGNSGNAASMRGENQHLHFEIRTAPRVGKGLAGRVDPADLYGVRPLAFTIHQAHGLASAAKGGRPGLKVTGFNVLE